MGQAGWQKGSPLATKTPGPVRATVNKLRLCGSLYNRLGLVQVQDENLNRLVA